MSGFDRTLGALSRQEMLECARGLLKYLAGAEARGVSGEGGGLGIAGGVRRSGGRGVSAEAEAGAFGTGARGLAEAGRAERGADEVRRVGRGRRELERTQSPESERGSGGEPDGLERHERGSGAELEGLERREREVGFSGGSRERGTERDGAQAGGAGAVFQGPERRYENAVGARGMEMSRVSDYFRRDSRRYDAGFTRY